MQYELGPRVHMNPATMQLLADVWANRETSFPLYVVRLVRTHVQSGFFVSHVSRVVVLYTLFFPIYTHVLLFVAAYNLLYFCLYCCRIMQYFGTHYSTMLPRASGVLLHFADDDENVYPATLVRPYTGDQLARISGGWQDFVHMNGLRPSDIYVVKIREIPGHLSIRFFPVDE